MIPLPLKFVHQYLIRNHFFAYDVRTYPYEEWCVVLRAQRPTLLSFRKELVYM